MKPKPLALSLGLVIIACLFFTFCKKERGRSPLVTSSVTSAGIEEAFFTGVLYSPGDSKVTEKGVCWGPAENVTINDTKVICTTEEQNFTAHITGLKSASRYYGRAYAINDFGVAYGKIISFTTVETSTPYLTLGLSTSPASRSVALVFSASHSKPSSFKAGFCWSKTNTSPTVDDATVPLVERTYASPLPYSQQFPYVLANLEPSKTYYARTFLQMGSEVTYGDLVRWTTADPPPIINPLTFSLRAVGHTTALCDVSLANIDPALVKATGVCWSENAQPTLSDNATETQTYYSSTTFNLENLNVNTTYYIRAYVKTDDDIIYGKADKLIHTYKDFMEDIDGNIYNTVEIGGLEWMASNLRVSNFANGSPINNVSGNNYNAFINYLNGQSPISCYYADNAGYNETLGKLYPRYVAQNPNLPPPGWRLPTQQEWEALITNTNGDLCIKNGSWQDNSITNFYGFSLYAAGYWNSGFTELGNKTRFWMSASAYTSFQFYSFNTSGALPNQSAAALSVRFVKN